MPKLVLTDKFCRTAPHPEAGQALYFDAHKDAPAGFALRITPGAKSWMLNYYVEGRQRRLTLPVGYGEAPLWGPKRARTEASKIKTAIHAGADPIAQREAKREAKREAAEAAHAKRDKTLGALLIGYADALEAAGKQSAGKVRRQVAIHVEKRHPKLWARPAADLQAEDAVDIVSTLVKAGKVREAAKLRATLRAAFAMATRARLDPSASSELRALGIRANPVADMGTVDGGSGGTRERALSEAELRAYWTRVTALPDPCGALLRFHLLTGGQRVDQLVRVTTHEVDRDAGVMVLLDGKGRRKKARRHAVPLLPEALDALDAMAPKRSRAGQTYVATIDGGRSGVAFASVAYRVREVAAAMVEAGEAAAMFTPGDLRRTVETRLAAAGVSSEIRAQLQSHGLGGVQARHYDRHGYADEKRAALTTLRRLLDSPATADVVSIRGRRA